MYLRWIGRFLQRKWKEGELQREYRPWISGETKHIYKPICRISAKEPRENTARNSRTFRQKSSCHDWQTAFWCIVLLLRQGGQKYNKELKSKQKTKMTVSLRHENGAGGKRWGDNMWGWKRSEVEGPRDKPEHSKSIKSGTSRVAACHVDTASRVKSFKDSDWASPNHVCETTPPLPYVYQHDLGELLCNCHCRPFNLFTSVYILHRILHIKLNIMCYILHIYIEWSCILSHFCFQAEYS
jgi:hypothetical protein